MDTAKRRVSIEKFLVFVYIIKYDDLWKQTLLCLFCVHIVCAMRENIFIEYQPQCYLFEQKQYTRMCVTYDMHIGRSHIHTIVVLAIWNLI